MPTFKSSLKLQLTLGAMAVGVVLLLAQALLQYRVLRAELTERIHAHQFQQVSELAAHLDEKLDDRLQALARAGLAVPESVLQDPVRMEKHLQQQSALLTLFDDLYLFDAQGVLQVDWPIKPGRRLLDMGSRDYIKGVIASRAPFVSQPILGRATQQPIVVMAVPVFNTHKELVAIMGGVLNLYKPNLLGALPTRKNGDTGYFYLISPERVMIAHPDKSRILKTLDTQNSNPSLEAAIQGFEGTREGVNSRGLAGLFTFKRLHSTGWILASVVPSAEAFRPLHAVGEQLFLVTAALLALTLPLLWFFARGLLRPLGKLAQAMQDAAARIQPRAAAQPVAVDGPQEVRTVVHAFNNFLAARNHAEADLAASEQRMQLLVENVTDGIWDWDLQRRQVYINPILRQLMGQPMDRPTCTLDTVLECIAPDDRAHVQQAWNDCISGRQPVFEIEHRLCTQAGGWRWVLASGRVVDRDSHGVALRLMGTVVDVSARRDQMEKLAQAKQTAEEASDAKSNFLANMSHEIRTPMNGIMGMTSLCLQTELTTTQRNYLEMIDSSAQSLMAVINDILDFSKIEARRLELDPQSFSLHALLRQTARTLSLRADEKGLELILRTDPDLPDQVVGDPLRLQQVLTNLLGNAIKFTSQGHVSLQARQIFPPGATPEPLWLELRIQDTGIGIPADKQAAIFDAFTQADTTTARRFGGTGLGLAISRSLVELMGGQIEVHSQPAHGSTFTVTLCLPAWTAPARPKPPPPQGQAWVLADHPAQAEWLVELLTRAGWTAGRLSKPDELLAHRASARLLVLDTRLPGRPDAQALSQLRAQAPELSQLLWVGPMQDQALADLPGWRQAFVIKPFDAHELRTALDTLAGGAPPTPTTPTAPQPTQDLHLGKKVLLAEDTPINQKLAGLLLARLGCEVSLAQNGVEAVSAFQAGVFDVILMDIQMPEMGGLEATAHIRALEKAEQRHPTPIVALTANALKGDRERYMDAGMDGYIAKPMSMTTLQAELLRVLPATSSAHAEN